MRKDDVGNLRLEAEITRILDHEHSEETAADVTKALTLTPLDAALLLAVDGELDQLRKLVVEKLGDTRVAQFINYPKGQRGKKLRTELRSAVGEETRPTIIQRATATKRRIQRLFDTDYPLPWRRANNVDWSAAHFAARYWCRDADGILRKEFVNVLEDSIEERDRQSRKRSAR